MNLSSPESQRLIKQLSLPPSCSCSGCKEMCIRTPCLGTPADILTLINNGYISQLSYVTWAAGLQFGYPLIPMVQLRNKNGSGCTMYSNGLCGLHEAGLKPTEGVLSSHGSRRVSVSQHPAFAVAFTWLDSNNSSIINKIQKALEKYEQGNSISHE